MRFIPTYRASTSVDARTTVEFLSNGLDTESLGSDRSHGSEPSAINDVVGEDENYSLRARIISVIFLPLS